MRPSTLTAAAILACAIASQADAETRVTERDIGALLVHCDKPVASITVGAFTCKAEACMDAPPSAGPAGFSALLQMAQAAQGLNTATYPHLGGSMSAALTTALKATGCFAVQDREDLEELQREAAVAGVQLKPTAADFIISGSITSVALTSRSNTIGGGILPVVGAVSRSTHQAALGVDLRLIDVKNASVRDSRAFSADSTRTNWGLGGGGVYGSGGLFGTARSTQSPELDSVANEVVIAAANFVAEDLAGPAITARPSAPIKPR